MRKKLFYCIGILVAVAIFNVKIQSASAAKSPTPRITEINVTSQNNNRKSVRAHFQIQVDLVKNGEIIKVKYKLKTRKFSDLRYKPPKSAKKTGTVSSACSKYGSAIDLSNLLNNNQKDKRFSYELQVKIKQPGKKWSNWSGKHDF